jgi:hypothetical protein
MVYGSTVIPLPEEVQLHYHHSPENHCRATPSRGKECATTTITPPTAHAGLHRRAKGVTRVSVEKLPERAIPVCGYGKYAAPVARLPMANCRLAHRKSCLPGMIFLW